MVDSAHELPAAGVARGPEAAERPARPKRRLRIPLQAAAALSVIVLLSIVVAGLSWQAYRGSQQALISASNDSFGYVRDALAEKVKRLLGPAQAQLSFLVHSQISDATTLPDRLRLVPSMAGALKNNPLLDALYMGYPDGEFILFRELPDDEARKRFAAPDNAVLVVQDVTVGYGGERTGQYRFYDSASTLVGSRLDPSYTYDPRTRGWYQATINQSDSVLTDPYIFFTTNKVGITLAQRTADGGAVVGLDLRLTTIAEQIASLRITPSTEIALINRKDQVVGYKDERRMVIRDPSGDMRLATIGELNSAPLLAAYNLSAGDRGQARGHLAADGRTWQLIQAIIDVTDTRKLRLLIAVPDDEFFAAARDLVWRQLVIAFIISCVSILAAWWLTKLMVKPLRRLVDETARIEQFDFDSEGRVTSMIGEIDDLGRGLYRSKRTIRKFLNIGRALAAERDIKPLIDRVLSETIGLARSDGGAIFMLDDTHTAIIPETERWMQSISPRAPTWSTAPIPLDRPGIIEAFAQAVRESAVIVTERMLTGSELSMLGLKEASTALSADRLTFVVVPLLDRNQIAFGLLVLIKAVGGVHGEWKGDERLISLIHAVSGNASVAIQNKLLLEAQRKLIDSLIKLVAGAIDAKSAYTGGHCQRVPVLTRMLAEAAAEQKEGPYRDFELSEDEWEALDIAAWLHDCGKVTTPEYVVDKATKLETIYDRIHEIRMRFEVLKRDAEIAYWRGVAQGSDEPALRKAMEDEKRALDDDFVFVAKANEGGEFMEPAKIERIKAIAARRWIRTISSRLGTSYEEKARMDKQPEPALPVEEPLLQDRYDHVVELAERDVIPADNAWGFALTVPKVKFNRGEVYNLCIQRGTLSEEERYRINDHIVQTIIMLESLPFPAHLRAVPELAGGHHEKMDGTGYPKRLKGGDMSVVARIMAIADVFEALTAADRPYKKAKTLSEAVKIMGFMKKDHHLDPELLDLFLTSGVWRQYAERFLAQDQIDEPDIAAVIATRPAAAPKAARA